jgi:hypothetical protein
VRRRPPVAGGDDLDVAGAECGYDAVPGVVGDDQLVPRTGAERRQRREQGARLLRVAEERHDDAHGRPAHAALLAQRACKLAGGITRRVHKG